MPEDISPGGWIVIVCFAALGFGLVRFLIVTTRDKQADEASKRAADDSKRP